MPNCRNCGSRLSKFDKDICPVCGFKHPLDGVSSETQEVTSEISFYKGELKTSKVRKRWLTLLHLTRPMMLLMCLISSLGRW